MYEKIAQKRRGIFIMNKNYTLKQKLLLKQMKNIENKSKQYKHPLTSYSMDTITRVDHKSTLKSETFIIDSIYEKQFEKKADEFLKSKSISYKKSFYILLLSLMTSSLLTAEKHSPTELELNIEALETAIDTNYKMQEVYQKISQNLTQNGNDTLHSKEIEEQLAKMKKILEMNAYLEEYSSYFNLDSEKVIALAKEATNNYEESFTKVIKNEKYDLTNPEAACMIFVYEIQIEREKSKIDFSVFTSPVENLKLSNEIITIPHDNLETLVLNNGYKFTNYVGKISDLFGYEKKIIALTLPFIEAGEKGSYSSRNRNNAWGMKLNGEFLVYPTFEGGIIDCIGRLANYYSSYDINNLENMSLKYESEDQKTREQWKSNFRDAYYKIEKNYEKYFGENVEENKHQKLILIKAEEK